MNGNRSKYTYTPTYGMQKRGLMKKSAASHQAPEAPDFTQIPDPAIGTPLQQTATQPTTSVPAPGAYMPAPSYFNQASQQQAPTQIPFAAPTFIQPGQQPQLPPLQTMTANVYQQNTPISSNVPTAQREGFWGRTQGFIPPQANAMPQQPMNPYAPQIGWNNPQAAQQSIPPFSGVNTNSMQQPFQHHPQPQTMAYAPLEPIPQQPGFTIQATAPHAVPRTPSMDMDKLWSIFLFGLLPLLFIPCLFVTKSWDALRYVFMGTTLVGLGVMWFRQMYTPVVRLFVSIVYVAACIITMAMLMRGAYDTRQAAANLANPVTPAVTDQTSESVPTADALAAAPTPAPTVTGPSEAERRLELFMELWKVNNTTEMVNLVQPSWRGQQENASTSLFIALANRTPENFTIEDISGTETDNSRTITMRATINKNTGKAPVVYRFMVMMVKEGGEWYINPNSLATNDAQETVTQDENVVKTQSSGAVTEPPRSTVTPAPPANTALYYNIGGNYYHMDPQCPSVGKDYLPFDASFSYADLRSYNRDLLPCLNCNAPIDPLD